MISNRYGFIFIHTPKTGGTSVSTALDRDIDNECEVVYGNTFSTFFIRAQPTSSPRYEEEITHVFPSSKDFPWWPYWMEHTALLDNHFVEYINYYNKEYNTNITMPLPRFGCDAGFSSHGWGGNIKHFPLKRWFYLIEDPRITCYGSFYDKYFFVGTCRNPYEREFSVFLYHCEDQIKEEINALKTSQISALLKDKWNIWAAEWKSLVDVEFDKIQ